MSRRKSGKPKYLAGVSWRDVLRGRPVTTADLDRTRHRRPRPEFRCRDCGHACAIRRPPPNPRCTACGGVLDPAAGSGAGGLPT